MSRHSHFLMFLMIRKKEMEASRVYRAFYIGNGANLNILFDVIIKFKDKLEANWG